MSQDGEKKRKRRSDAGEPRKKQHMEKDITVKLRHASNTNDGGLLVASGPGIVVPEKVKFQAYRKSEGGKELLLRSSDHPKLNYTAEERQDGAEADEMRHYIGLFDPETKEMELIPAKHVSLRSTVKSEDDLVLAQRIESEDIGVTARRTLGLEFGTKKAQKAIAQSRDNRVTTSDKQKGKTSATEGAVLSMLEESALDAPTMEAIQAEVNAAKPRPKHNINATRPEDAYTRKDVVGEEMMNKVKVKPWKDAVDTGEEVKVASRFVSRRIEALAKDDNIAILKVLKYILALINFHNECTIKGKAVRKLPKREVFREKMGESEDVIGLIIKRFTNDGTLRQWDIDLIRTTLAVLTLMVDGWSSDTSELREDLQLKAPEMNKYFAEVGARVKPPTEDDIKRLGLGSKQAAVTHGMARLKIPLEFPKPRAIPARRK